MFIVIDIFLVVVVLMERRMFRENAHSSPKKRRGREIKLLLILNIIFHLTREREREALFST